MSDMPLSEPLTKKILDSPYSKLSESTRRFLVELNDGTRFWIVGGKDQRPILQGQAYFSPGEFLKLSRELDGSVESLRVLVVVKQTFGGKVLEITKNGENHKL